MSYIKDTQRQMADFAYKCACDGAKEERSSEYKSYAKRIPTMIKTNGLAETFAFVFSKISNKKSESGYAYKLLYEQITIWFKEESGVLPLPDLKKEEDLIKEIIKLDSPTYRAATKEVLSLFNWLRRFAEGLIKEK